MSFKMDKLKCWVIFNPSYFTGGNMQISVSNIFTMDGTLDVDGHPGDSGSGGGSGGSIWLKIKDMRGHGLMSSIGMSFIVDLNFSKAS